jgi:NAD(P)-dependent dehydrogenase (short-subunit alcohol dehydrogenase family)
MVDENDPVQDVTRTPAGDRPEPTRRVVVVTGASSGIGLAAAEELARRGDHVVLVGRHAQRLRLAADRVRLASGAAPPVYRADFAVLDEVRALAEALLAAYPRIDVLANNAGALFPRRVTTVDGFELTIQANHLAPFLLTNLLRDRIDRVVTTASAAHRQGRLDPDRLDSPGRYVPLLVYGTSKQANILFAAEAARRWPGLLSVSYHPGVVRTRFGAENPVVAAYYRFAPWLRSPAKGADTLVWLATVDAAGVVNGGYYVDRRPRRPGGRAADPALAARLWEASERAVRPWLTG